MTIRARQKAFPDEVPISPCDPRLVSSRWIRMVIPPMVGLVLCRRVWAVFVVAVAVAMAAGFLGLWASFVWDLPTGPTIVCVEGVLFLLSVLVRGLRWGLR